MSRVKVVLNRPGVRELLKSDEVRNVLEECAGKMLNSLPRDGYDRDGRTTDRAVAVVYAATEKARIKNSKDNTLIKAMGAAKI